MPSLPSVRPARAESPLAFLGDIHGNLQALEAVLEELGRDGITAIHAVGDLVFGGTDPLSVWRRLEQAHAICVRGASDTALVSLSPEMLAQRSHDDAERVTAFLTTQKQLGDIILERIRRLPERHRIPLIDGREIVMVHGAPFDPLTEISHELTDEEMFSLVGDDPADIVVCAASHVPFIRDLGEVRVVNVGSVGDAPEGHVAHYTLIEPAIEAPVIAQRWVEY